MIGGGGCLFYFLWFALILATFFWIGVYLVLVVVCCDPRLQSVLRKRE